MGVWRFRDEGSGTAGRLVVRPASIRAVSSVPTDHCLPVGGRIVSEVPTVIRGKSKSPKYDPAFEGAAERIHAAVRELKELGLIDEKGNRIRKDLPEDMKEGAERDFGG